MEAAQLQALISEFLADAPRAVAIEDGAVLFDFASAKFSVSGDYGKCALHIWSPERNAVRRVLDAERRGDVLRLSVQRFGQPKPTKLELCRDRDQRTPTARRAARTRYRALLRRQLERRFPGWTIDKLTGEVDLERSFGPVATRGLIRQGNAAFAVFGINAEETQASVDASLTFAILWLDHCRETSARAWVEGLKLFVPAGMSAIVRERMAHLDATRAKWEIYEFDERAESLEPIDCSDRGNIETRLVHAADVAAARARFSDAIAQVRAMLPGCEFEAHIASAAEISFRIAGLEFARAETAFATGSFKHGVRLTFGSGAHEIELTDTNSPALAAAVRELVARRHAGGSRADALFRMAPERWLESIVVRDVSTIDDRLDRACVYSQVPAFSAADRAMIDVLTCTADGRLAILELKADEDIHLPLQGVDYWSRVVWHHARGEFQRFGYFPARTLSPEPPLLYLVAPALRVHPATDTLLKYLAPAIEVEVVGIDERWREGVRVVFRKRLERAGAAPAR